MDGQTQGMIPPFPGMLRILGRSGAALGSAAHSRALRARGEGLKTDLQDLLQIRIQQEIKYIHDYDSLFIPPRT